MIHTLLTLLDGLIKLKRYKGLKDYLQLAVKLTWDPIVSDHYGDVLWKMAVKFRPDFWNYVLKLEKTEEDLKKTVEQN